MSVFGIDPNRTDGDREVATCACEEAQRVAFLASDLQTLDARRTDDYAVDSPLQQVVTKPALLGLLRAGRIRHEACTFEIERVGRRGDVVTVTGNDRVVDPPDHVVTTRRFTNVQIYEGCQWRALARHAHALLREAPRCFGEGPGIALSVVHVLPFVRTVARSGEREWSSGLRCRRDS